MNWKNVIVILLLSAAMWAQNSQTTSLDEKSPAPSTTQAQACACCNPAAHHGKNTSKSCCAGKESCKNCSDASCADGKCTCMEKMAKGQTCCAGKDGKGCCAGQACGQAAAAKDTAAHSCCGSACARSHSGNCVLIPPWRSSERRGVFLFFAHPQ